MSVLTNDEYEEFNRVIHFSDISHEQAELLLRLVRRFQKERNVCANFERQLEERDTTHSLTTQDRDNRRRRMDLAMAILDEMQTLDLDRIAEVIWPNEEGAVSIAPIVASLSTMPKTFGEANLGMAVTPITSDPTQVPTPSGRLQTDDSLKQPPELCGFMEQLGNRRWHCTRPKFHEGYHSLDDGHDII